MLSKWIAHNITMRKISVVSLFLVVIYMALSATSLFIAKISDDVQLNIKLSNGFISDEAIYCSASNISRKQVVHFAELHHNSQLTIQFPWIDSETYAIYSANKAEPPMKNGRYFDINEYSCSDKLAVVGQNLLGRINNENNEQTIYINNQKFLVTGVMGSENISPIDSRIFVNAGSVITDSPEEFMFILDNGDDSNDLFSEFLRYLGKNYLSVSRIANDSVGASDVLLMIAKESQIFILIMACFSLSTIAVSIEWLDRKKMQIAVKRLIGIQPHMIWRELILQYACFVTAGLLLGILLGIRTIHSTRFDLLLFSLALSIGLSFLSSLPIVFLLKKQAIARAVK